MHKGKVSYAACQGESTLHSTPELLEPIQSKEDICRAEPRDRGLAWGSHDALAQGALQSRSKVTPWKTSSAERCLSQLLPELWHPLLHRGDHLCPSDCYPSPFWIPLSGTGPHASLSHP